MSLSRSSAAPARARVYGYVTLSLCALLLVATGRPTTKALDWMAGLGVPEGLAPVLAYAAPALVLVAMMALAHVLTRKRPLVLRWAAFLLLGAVAGYVLGFCLELFAGAGGFIDWAVGPLREAGWIEIGLWMLTAVCLALAGTTAFVAVLGSAGAAAMQVEPVAPEDIEVRTHERAMMGWSAAGMAALGVACGALALARQVEIDMRAAMVIAACVGMVVNVAIGIILWRALDELQRRMVIDSYAISAIAVTAGAFVWAAASALGAVGPIDAGLLFLALTAAQLIVAIHITAKGAPQGAGGGA
ncbi:MAG: hypothetical protein NVV62_15170 [Terricaulis sp.]|nr:hypothetical protein [Terricaulis sp.]